MTSTYLVVGLGRFGAHIARALYQQGANVLAIDKDAAAVDDLKDEVTRAVTCEADDAELLRALGAYDVDTAIVAIARAFDATVLVSHSLIQNGVKRILVRVESERQAQAVRALGATDIVFPEKDIAENVARRLIYPNLAEEIPLGDDYAVMEVTCPEQYAGKTLQEINIRKRFKVNVVAIKQVSAKPSGGDIVDLAPSPEMPLPAGCRLLLLGSLKKLDWFRKKHKLALHVKEAEVYDGLQDPSDHADEKHPAEN